jgi:hypothetical protein
VSVVQVLVRRNDRAQELTRINRAQSEAILLLAHRQSDATVVTERRVELVRLRLGDEALALPSGLAASAALELQRAAWGR